MSMTNFNDTIGTRTRDLPTCSPLTQPSALRRAMGFEVTVIDLILHCTRKLDSCCFLCRYQGDRAMCCNRPLLFFILRLLGNVSYSKRLTKSLVLKKVLGFGVEGMMMERGGCESEHGSVRYRGPE
jgi:hypothetical protein